MTTEMIWNAIRIDSAWLLYYHITFKYNVQESFKFMYKNTLLDLFKMF